MNLTSLLSKIPGNGYKTYLGLIAAALDLGLMQLGYIDHDSGLKILEWIGVWTGVAFAHKVDKSMATPPTPAV